MEYYSALKRNKIQTQTTTQMNLTNIMLSEISPRHRDKYCDKYEVAKTGKFTETGSRVEGEGR